MTLHPTSYRGVSMTAVSCDDDVALRTYVLQHSPRMMFPLERRVVKYSARIVSDAQDSKIQSLYNCLWERAGHVDDNAVIEAFQTPYDDRVANAVTRLIEARRNEIFENRCANANDSVRTPRPIS